jgi:hypothetical protein
MVRASPPLETGGGSTMNRILEADYGTVRVYRPEPAPGGQEEPSHVLEFPAAPGGLKGGGLKGPTQVYVSEDERAAFNVALQRTADMIEPSKVELDDVHIEMIPGHGQHVYFRLLPLPAHRGSGVSAKPGKLGQVVLDLICERVAAVTRYGLIGWAIGDTDEIVSVLAGKLDLGIHQVAGAAADLQEKGLLTTGGITDDEWIRIPDVT